MNKENLINLDLDTITVVDKRSLIRDLIKDGAVQNLTASQTKAINGYECDTIINKVKDEYRELLAEAEANESYEDYENNDDEIAEALKALTEKLSNRNNKNTVDSGLLNRLENVEMQIDGNAKHTIKLADEIADLKKVLSSPTVQKNIKTIQAKISGDNPILDEVTKYYSPNNEALANLMLLSPPSFGKSHAIRILGDSYDTFLEHNCSEDIDEIATLTGSVIPDSSGTGFINVDGVLTQAMRDASNGKSVLMFFDEVLRWNENVQAFLLTFLNGFEKEVNGIKEKFYRLTTRKNVNGSLEVIEASAKNLNIISGANLTSALPIEAFWSRFKKSRFDFSIELASKVAKSIIQTYNIDYTNDAILTKNDVDGLSSYFALLMAKTREMVTNGTLQYPFDFRLMKSIIEMSDSTTGSILSKVKDEIHNDLCSWNPDSGCILEESKKELDEAIDNINKLEAK